MNAQSARQTNWFLVWFAFFLVALPLCLALGTFSHSGHPRFASIVATLYLPLFLVYLVRNNRREYPSGRSFFPLPYPEKWGFVKLKTPTQKRGVAWLIVLLAVGGIGNIARCLWGHPSLICVGSYAAAVATAWLVSDALFERQIKTT